MPNSERSDTASAQPSTSADELQQVRDLIVGHHARETDVALEGIRAQIERLGDDIGSRIQTLEVWIREQFSELRAGLERQDDAISSGLAEAKDGLDNVETRLTAVVAQTREELSRRSESAEADLTRNLEKVRDETPDRNTLSALFEELAQRIQPKVDSDPPEEPDA